MNSIKLKILFVLCCFQIQTIQPINKLNLLKKGILLYTPIIHARNTVTFLIIKQQIEEAIKDGHHSVMVNGIQIPSYLLPVFRTVCISSFLLTIGSSISLANKIFSKELSFFETFLDPYKNAFIMLIVTKMICLIKNQYDLDLNKETNNATNLLEQD